jgi:N-acetylglucosamine-6-sulfatase
MTNNSAQGNCSSFDWQQGPEKDTIAVHLEKAGYHTAYFGKYLNLYGENCCGGLQHVPPGWSTWSGLQGNSRYYNYSLSINGKEEKHADNYADDYLPDLITNRSIQLIQQVHLAS